VECIREAPDFTNQSLKYASVFFIKGELKASTVKQVVAVCSSCFAGNQREIYGREEVMFY
jgi:hypothetical protein